MDNNGVDMIKNDNRSELVGKVEIKESPKKKNSRKKNTKVNLEQTIALDTLDILKAGNVKSHTEEEKRSEITGKVGSKKKSKNEVIKDEDVKEVTDIKKVKSEKISLDDVSMQQELSEDKTQENVENVSLAMIAMIVLFLAVLFVVVGYMLYKIALTNSDATALIFRGLGF